MVVQHSAWFIDDMRYGPSAEQGVVCVSFSPASNPNPPGTVLKTRRRGKPSAVTLAHSYGLRDEITFEHGPAGTWRTGLGARIVELCKSHSPFTLWRWPRTEVIADVE